MHKDIVTTPLGWRSMWIIAFFDLPNDTPQRRKRYALFRKHLLNDGFSMMQYSVYTRHCATRENASIHIDRLSRHIPPEGEVCFMQITDNQFANTTIFRGKKHVPPQKAPAQLEFF